VEHSFIASFDSLTVEERMSRWRALVAKGIAVRRVPRHRRFGGHHRARHGADLVLLDADPLDDIGTTRRIAGVVLRGRWLDRAALDRLLEAVERAEDRRVNDWKRGEPR
jgi:hypothetical protein